MKKETENECCCCQRKSNFSWDGVVAFFMGILKWAGFKTPDEVMNEHEKEHDEVKKPPEKFKYKSLDDEDERLGGQYFYGYSRLKNYFEAWKHYKLAASRMNVYALMQLGLMEEKGLSPRCGEEDLTFKAEEPDVVIKKCRDSKLGTRHNNVNMEAARFYYEQAAFLGYSPAQVKMGDIAMMNALKHTWKLDIVSCWINAYAWYSLAYANHSGDAAEYMHELEKHMDLYQIFEAQRSAQIYLRLIKNSQKNAEDHGVFFYYANPDEESVKNLKTNQKHFYS